MQSGDKVHILYPEYAAGAIGIVLEQETLQDGSKTGYWLVQVEDDEMLLALLPQDVKLPERVKDARIWPDLNG